MDPTDERTYHGTLNRLVIVQERVNNATRWHLGYPGTKNMERLNQLIPLSEVEVKELEVAQTLLGEVIESAKNG